MYTQGPKNHSSLSTQHNEVYYRTSRNLMQSQRPHTANLIYANKPYKKQVAQWNQSVSTWRFSSRKASFSKQKRFRTNQPYSLDIIEPSIQSKKSQKATSFGKGKRTPIPEYILRNAKQKPSPTSYTMTNVDEMTRSPSKGRTFAQNWDKYEKIYLNHRKDMYSSHFLKHNPGAKYNVRQNPGKQKHCFSLYGRQKMFTQKMSDMMRDVPGSHYSINDRHLYSTMGINNWGFTTGSRLDLSAPANQNPAGNHYKISGFSEKYKNTKKKNYPKKLY